jgi:hypothetical protein
MHVMEYDRNHTAATASFLRRRKAYKSPKKGFGPPDRPGTTHFVCLSQHFIGQKTILSPQCQLSQPLYSSPPLQMAPDLKQVAALFNDCIETIRNERHAGLEQMAVDWLKGARYDVMRKIEAECDRKILLNISTVN